MIAALTADVGRAQLRQNLRLAGEIADRIPEEVSLVDAQRRQLAQAGAEAGPHA